MKPFDGNDYRKTVMRAALDSGTLPDAFARYRLDYDDSDEAQIRARMDAVRKFWNADRGQSSKYRDLYEQLEGEHLASSLVLLDARERVATAKRLQEQARAALREPLERLAQATKATADRYAGLPPSERGMLEALGVGYGLPADMVARELDAYPAVAEPSADAIPATTRKQIAQSLAAFERAGGEPSRTRSLYAFVGLSDPSTPPDQIAPRIAQLAAENRGRNERDPQKKLVDRVLGLAKTWLVDEQPGLYRAAFRGEVREQLRVQAIEMSLDDRRLDELEARRLLERAIEHGLPRDDAAKLLSELAGELGVSLEFGAAVDYVHCGNCARVVPAERAPDRCPGCGEPLFRDCPGCGKRCAQSDVACTACGFDVAAIARCEQIVATGREQLGAGRPSAAAAAAAQALALVTDDSDALQLDRTARNVLDRADQAWRRAERALSERRLFEARDQLCWLAADATDVSGPSGDEPGAKLESVAAQVAAIQSQLDDARALPRGEPREATLIAVLERAADCADAATELAATPPQPPQSVRLELTEHGVHVAWAPSHSPGRVEYLVARGNGAAPPTVGSEPTGRAAIAEYEDGEVVAGDEVGYAVVAVRAGGRSTVARSETLLVAHEAGDLQVREGDGEVVVSWTPLAGGSARVERTRDDTGETTTIMAGASGVRDVGVVNGVRYRYRVAVEYRSHAGGTVVTRGREVQATPQERPRPVLDLTLRGTADDVELSWGDTARDVRVLRCAAEPGVEPGSDVDVARLHELGTTVAAHGSGARDRTGNDVAWYLPVTVGGGHAVAGRAVRHVKLPPIAGVRAIDLKHALRVTWEWPESCSAATVVWRGDRQPTGPDDPDAQSRSTTKAEYRDLGGVELPLPPTGSLFVTVYPAARIGGELVHGANAGPGATAALRRRERRDVRYSVRRTGRRKRKVELEATSDGPLPELVVVARAGDMLPLSADQGRAVAHLGGDAEATATSCELDLKELGTPTALRAFLAKPDGGAHRLVDPDASELILR